MPGMWKWAYAYLVYYKQLVLIWLIDQKWCLIIHQSQDLLYIPRSSHVWRRVAKPYLQDPSTLLPVVPFKVQLSPSIGLFCFSSFSHPRQSTPSLGHVGSSPATSHRINRTLPSHDQPQSANILGYSPLRSAVVDPISFVTLRSNKPTWDNNGMETDKRFLPMNEAFATAKELVGKFSETRSSLYTEESWRGKFT